MSKRERNGVPLSYPVGLFQDFVLTIQSFKFAVVPLAGIEPALLAELDFESSASTNSATGAYRAWPERAEVAKRAEYSGR